MKVPLFNGLGRSPKEEPSQVQMCEVLKDISHEEPGSLNLELKSVLIINLHNPGIGKCLKGKQLLVEMCSGNINNITQLHHCDSIRFNN